MNISAQRSYFFNFLGMDGADFAAGKLGDLLDRASG